VKVDLAKPDITDREINAVIDVMKSGILSIGKKVEEFENRVASYVGMKYGIAVNSGSSGLNLIIKALGIGSGDQVITTPFSFIASTNCFLMEGAVPVFVDIDPKTLNMDIDKVEEKITTRTKAILAVDAFGQPINMIKLRLLADKYKLFLIEDSCEAIGSAYKGIRAGQLSDAAVFGFYPNKQITTAEGGLIVTNNRNIEQMCRSLRSQGRAIAGFWLHHERLGYNYRMSELHAALGCVQMERIEEILLKRQKVASMYNKILGEIKGITTPYIDSKVTNMSWFVYVIQVDSNINRDKMMTFLKENGVSCRPYFTPIHIQPFIKEMFGFEEEDFPITAETGRRSMALPFFNNLSEEEIKYVGKIIHEGIDNLTDSRYLASTKEEELNAANE
jgi:perosamine synthetase